LSTVEDGTLFELSHVATVPPGMWEQFGPGAVGVGWDGGLLGMALHLRSGGGVAVEDHEAFERSPEAREFHTRSAQLWGEAHRASGASPDEVAATVAATTAFYVPPLE